MYTMYITYRICSLVQTHCLDPPFPFFCKQLLPISNENMIQSEEYCKLHIFNMSTLIDNVQVFANLLRVEEGGSSFLMEEHLLVRDADSLMEKLRVEVRTQPQHGRLELQGVVLSEGESFHLQDLKALRVR